LKRRSDPEGRSAHCLQSIGIPKAVVVLRPLRAGQRRPQSTRRRHPCPGIGSPTAAIHQVGPKRALWPSRARPSNALKSAARNDCCLSANRRDGDHTGCAHHHQAKGSGPSEDMQACSLRFGDVSSDLSAGLYPRTTRAPRRNPMGTEPFSFIIRRGEATAECGRRASERIG
jgi:hypothetical protein